MQFNFLFSVDGNYINYFYVLIKSIFNTLDFSNEENKVTKDELSFHLIVDATVDQEQVLNQFNSIYDEFSNKIKASLIFHQIDNSLFDSATRFSLGRRLNNDDMKKSTQTYATYYRLMVGEVLDASINSVLYMDIDMLVFSDIRKLFYDYDLSNTILYAQTDYCIRRSDFVVHKTTGEKSPLDMTRYFNGGLLLINLALWRKLNVHDLCFDVIANNDLAYHDQTLLNYICQYSKFPAEIVPVKYFKLIDNFYDSYFLCSPHKKNGRLAFKIGDDFCNVDFTTLDLLNSAKNVRVMHYIMEKPWLLEHKFTPEIASKEYCNIFNKWVFTAEELPFANINSTIIDPCSAAYSSAVLFARRKARSKFKLSMLFIALTWVMMAIGFVLTAIL